jgi:Sec-independent protein translocase protein TatA
MDFLGVGPLELFFILIIALIVLGPKDMVKTGRTIGSFLRRLVTSPTWRTVQQTSRDLRYLPNKLMREAGMEEDMQDLKKIGQEIDQLSKTPTSISQDLKKSTDSINQGLSQDLSAWTTPIKMDIPIIDSPPPPVPNPEPDRTDPAPEHPSGSVSSETAETDNN